jgi:hypothetical protein
LLENSLVGKQISIELSRVMQGVLHPFMSDVLDRKEAMTLIRSVWPEDAYVFLTKLEQGQLHPTIAVELAVKALAARSRPVAQFLEDTPFPLPCYDTCPQDYNHATLSDYVDRVAMA